MSAGSASATGPGRPLTAVWNARETSSGTREARSICATRCRILLRSMDADACVRSSRSAADDADTGRPRQLPVSLRHIRRGALVPANDQSDVVLRVAKRVEHRKEALARNAEDRVHTLNAQSIDEQLGAGLCWIIVRSHPILCLDFRQRCFAIWSAILIIC